jgi:DNA transformation protein and related proteins
MRKSTSKPMASFATFILDQLDELNVTARKMFGGYGVYQGGICFALIAGGETLFFKIDDESRAAYIERGMKPFSPNQKQTLVSYYEVPLDVIEDSEMLIEWARRAIKAAVAAKADK